MTEKYYKNFAHIILGWKTVRSMETGRDIKSKKQRRSNFRRLYSKFCIFLCVILSAEPLFFQMETGAKFYSVLALLGFLSLAFFVWVVVMTPFRTSKTFTVNPQRLMFDTVISSMLMILVFALTYRAFGTDPCGTPLDNIYFSAVTFSTLGFGDIGPAPDAQGFAAMAAMLGNLHLGIIVAATFAALTNNVKR